MGKANSMQSLHSSAKGDISSEYYVNLLLVSVCNLLKQIQACFFQYNTSYHVNGLYTEKNLAQNIIV